MLPYLPGDGVWSVICFAVARGARRTGVGDALLAGAVEHARAHGARILEAYPVQADGAWIAPSSAYCGTVTMFARAGFRIAATTKARKGGHPQVVVRRTV